MRSFLSMSFLSCHFWVRSPRFWSQNQNPTNEHRCSPTWTIYHIMLFVELNLAICCSVSSASKVCLGLGLVGAHTHWRPCTDSHLYVACFCNSYCIGQQCGSCYKPLAHLPLASHFCSSLVQMLEQLFLASVSPVRTVLSLQKLKEELRSRAQEKSRENLRVREIWERNWKGNWESERGGKSSIEIEREIKREIKRENHSCPSWHRP